MPAASSNATAASSASTTSIRNTSRIGTVIRSIRNRRFRADVAALFVLLVLFNLPFLAPGFIPVHDTMNTFQLFHTFYSEWLFRRHLALWMPVGGFGIPAAFSQLSALSPMSYLVGFVGGLAGVRDALGLFKLSVLLEQLVLVAGMSLLARELFTRRSTVLLVGICAIGSTVWYSQLPFNLRLYYLFPLMCWCLLRFVRESRSRWLWRAGTILWAWLLGAPIYFLPIWLLSFGLFAAALVWETPRCLRGVLPRGRREWLALGACLAVGATYLYAIMRSPDGMTILAAGRDPKNGKVILLTFLTYGRATDITAVLRSLCTGWPAFVSAGGLRDSNVYAGFLATVAFVMALIHRRRAAFLAPMVCLVWLSLGGLFARWLYHHAPLMDRYRHIGLVYGLVKVLLIVLAGYGWEAFWSSRTKLRDVLIAWAVLLFAVDAFIFQVWQSLDDAVEQCRWDVWRLPGLANAIWAPVFRWRLLVYGGLLVAGYGLALVTSHRDSVARRLVRAASGPAVRAALLVGLIADLGVYQVMAYRAVERPASPDSTNSTLLAAQPPKWLDQRTQEPLTDRGLELMKRLGPGSPEEGRGEVYSSLYPVAEFDPCQPVLRENWRATGVARLLEANPPIGLAHAIGCQAPKLRLLSRAIAAPTLKDATTAVQRASLDQVVVLRTPQPIDLGRAPARSGQARVAGFGANELIAEVDVDSPRDAWLVYADAWHPGWHASVNGRGVPVVEANLAFKAVALPPGHSTVRFWFWNGWPSWACAALAVFGAASGAALVAVCWAALWDDRRTLADHSRQDLTASITSR